MNLHFKVIIILIVNSLMKNSTKKHRAANNKTSDDVYQNAIELLDYLKKEYSKEDSEEIKMNLDDIQWEKLKMDGC